MANKIFSAFDSYAKAQDASRITLVETLRKLGLDTLEAVKPHALEWAAARTGCPLVDGQRRAAGTKVLDASHPKFHAARKSVQRLMEAFKPAEAPKRAVTRKQADPVAQVLARFEKLTKAQQKAFLKQIGA